MKTTTTRITRGLLLLAAIGLMGWTTAGTTFADDDHDSHHHEAWSHDHDGYWDGHGERHAFIFHENHHGYWRQRDDGTRIFINID